MPSLGNIRALHADSNGSPVPVLHVQLESTLRLLTLMSPSMTTTDIMRILVRLKETDIVMSQLLVERDRTGKLTFRLS